MVNRVRPSTRVGPDGFVVSEIGASFVQSVTLSKSEARNKLGLRVDSDYYTVRGGGLLRFDEGGRLCFAALKPVMDAEWQQEKLETIKREAGTKHAGGNLPPGGGTPGVSVRQLPQGAFRAAVVPSSCATWSNPPARRPLLTSFRMSARPRVPSPLTALMKL